MSEANDRRELMRAKVVEEIVALSSDAKEYLGDVLRLEREKLGLKRPALTKDLTDIAKRIIK